MFSSSI